MKDVVELLTKRNETIATMESCTGGGVVNAITNIEGASEVLKYSAITYSNDFKIKMGVSSEVIDKYSVYSLETANEMSKNISDFADSTYGIGVTGKLNRVDRFNTVGQDNVVYISVYNRIDNKYYTDEIKVSLSTREDNKKLVIDTIIELLKKIIS